MTDENSGLETGNYESEKDRLDRNLWDKARSAGMSRRNFLALTALGGSAAVLAACGVDSTPATIHPTTPQGAIAKVPLPPVGAKMVTTACDYCSVGCGYKVYNWPVGSAGGHSAAFNALGVDFPVNVLSGTWISPNMHNVVEIDGRPHNVVIMPDWETEVVNVRGDHSVRGGTLAQKLYSADKPTKDRLQQPQLRLDGELTDISWEDATALIAEISSYVIEQFGEAAWGMKMYSYAYYENTYALTKLALGAINTPAWAPHDKPAAGSDTPGLSDAGIDAFSASYEDWKGSEVIYLSGVSLYESKSILFQEWIARGGAKLVVVNPRKDYTAAFAVQRGGIHLQLEPGTDTVLNNSIAWVILENGWEDSDFIRERTVSESELSQETSWRRKMFGATFQQYKDFIMADDAYRPENAETITKVPADQIREAARMLAEPKADGSRPKTSLMLEKGNYWGHNYENSASFAAMGLLTGAGGRPGRAISRGGGHQRGMISAAGYPKDKSRDNYKGNIIGLNVDRWAAEGNLRFMWAIGSAWFSAMGASGYLSKTVGAQIQIGPRLTRNDAFPGGGQQFALENVLDMFKSRVDAGGMVLVQQEIYSNALTPHADMLLPAAPWGEEEFARMQGERRLRMYSKFMEPPGQAKPDWWIIAQVAQRMGFEGFDWKDSNEIFEEAAERSKGGVHDYAALVEMARSQGKRAHDLLRALGTTGIQCPIKLENGDLVGTVRIHQDSFGTASGKAVFPKGDWRSVEPFQREFAPQGDELWVTNMRINEHWQSQFDDIRIPYRWDRFPVNILEINPSDAASRGIESGDDLEIRNDNVLTQTGGRTTGKFSAVAYVTDQVPPGVTCAYFLFGQGRLDMAANSIAPGQADPINNRYRYKLGKGTVTRTGESEFKHTMSFVPRNLI